MKEVKKYKHMAEEEQKRARESARNIYNSGLSFDDTSRELFKMGITDIPSTTLGKILSQMPGVKIRKQEDYFEGWREKYKNQR